MKLSNTMLSDAKLAYQNRQEPEHLLYLGRWYWRMILGLSLFLTVCAIAYGVWQLVDIFGFFSEDVRAQTLTPRAPLNHEKLSETLQSFSDRKTRLQELQNQAPVINDPSR